MINTTIAPLGWKLTSSVTFPISGHHHVPCTPEHKEKVHTCMREINYPNSYIHLLGDTIRSVFMPSSSLYQQILIGSNSLSHLFRNNYKKRDTPLDDPQENPRVASHTPYCLEWKKKLTPAFVPFPPLAITYSLLDPLSRLEIIPGPFRTAEHDT